MLRKWTDSGKKRNLRILFWIGLITVLFLLLSVAGTIRNEKGYKEPKQDYTEAEMTETENETENGTEKEPFTEPVIESLSNEIILSPEDQNFLTQLTRLFDQRDLEGAARLLDDYDILWKEFPCMYDGTVMKEEITTGRNLVFVKPSTVFYGDFNYGKPEGECTALQIIELEEGKRYDYACGMWSNGKMNGIGTCGYNYYDGVVEDVTRLNRKTGMFQDDFMQGEITYSSTNGEWETAVWQFRVLDGVIVMDERWLEDTDSSGEVIYKLISEEDQVHAYILGEIAIGEDRWKNLILFPFH